jgi:hypothetical protein
MDWFESNQTLVEHRAHTKAALALWAQNHPDQPPHLTLAQAEYAARLGLPEDYFRLTKAWTPTRVAEYINNRSPVPCPRCGRRLEFETVPTCPQVNPRGYTGLFDCQSPGCPYHFYTVEGLLDVRNKIRDRAFDRIEKVMGA